MYRRLFLHQEAKNTGSETCVWGEIDTPSTSAIETTFEESSAAAAGWRLRERRQEERLSKTIEERPADRLLQELHQKRQASIVSSEGVFPFEAIESNVKSAFGSFLAAGVSITQSNFSCVSVQRKVALLERSKKTLPRYTVLDPHGRGSVRRFASDMMSRTRSYNSPRKMAAYRGHTASSYDPDWDLARCFFSTTAVACRYDLRSGLRFS